MSQILVVQVPDTAENREAVRQLVGVPGAVIKTVDEVQAGEERLVNLAEAANIAGFSYQTFRRIAIEQGKIPHVRPAGGKGHPRFKLSDIIHFKERRFGRKTKEVQII